MNLLGKNVGECRLPLIRMEEAKIEKLRRELVKAGLLK
jgi:4-hydroxy-tetrahydrodipicolinate synthase